jgi:purine nucleoside phosphorylase
MDTMIGVIGGSGVYQMDGLDDAEWVSVESPFGTPSDQILTGRLGGCERWPSCRVTGGAMCIRRPPCPTAPISTR